MSTKSRDKDSGKLGSLKSDDLGLIRGIGPARRQWLRETFHIETIADLAAFSADTIYTRLKEEQIVSLSKIESWIEQAREMVESGVYSSKLKVQENGWKPFASFVVEFQEEVATGERQTKAHHVETDKTVKWPGIEHEALCGWFVEQLGSKIEAPKVDPTMSTPNHTTQPLYSDRLQEILGKIDRLSNEQHPQPALKTPQSPLQISGQDQLLAVVAKAERLEANSSGLPNNANLDRPSGFSEKLQAVLARAQKLSSKTS